MIKELKWPNKIWRKKVKMFEQSTLFLIRKSLWLKKSLKIEPLTILIRLLN